MLGSVKRKGAGTLLNLSFLRYTYFLLVLSIASAKVENSFSNSQYPQYKEYYGSTPGYQYPDLTVKSGSTGDISNSPIITGDVPSQDPLLSQSSAQQPVVHGSPNQHVYYYETYPMQDTSRGNVYSVPGPGGNKRCTHMANGSMKCYSRQDYGGYGVSNDYDTTGGDDGGSLGGLAGLIGLLGLKGLKGLATVVGPLLLFPLFLPILLPLLLPLLLILLLPLLLIPIPVISVPAPTVRSLQSDFSEARKMASGVFERVISSDECIERIACEISKMSRKRKAGDWIEKALNYLPENSPISKRIFKGFDMMNNTTLPEREGKSEQTTCSMLKCKMLSLFESQKG